MSDRRVIIISDLGGGGSQRVVLSLTKHWIEAGHEVTVITLSDHESDKISLPSGVKRVALNCTQNSAGIVSSLRNNLHRTKLIRQAIFNSNADQVISLVAATNILCILACWGLSPRLIISERNDPSRQKIGFIWEILRRGLYRFADCVTANSQQAISVLSNYVPKSRLIFVPNPLPEWDDALPPQSSREKIILAVGRLHKQKAYDLLLPIYAASEACTLGWKLVILGEGEERRTIKKLAEELGISQYLILPGYQKAVKTWYDRSSLFMMTSQFEGNSNALIEAIYRGLPIIVSCSAGDGPTYARSLSCGVVIEPEKIKQSANVLNNLLNDQSLRKKFSELGSAGIVKLHSDEIVYNSWETALSNPLN